MDSTRLVIEIKTFKGLGSTTWVTS